MLLKKIFDLKKDPDFINDRRRAKRYDMILKLNYFDPVTNSPGETLTKNISKNGLRFPVNSRLPKGTLLDIKIEDPNSSKFLSLKGKITWLKEFPGEKNAEAVRYETGVNLLRKSIF